MESSIIVEEISSTFYKFKELLLKAGFSKEFVDNFKIVLWDIRNGYYGGRKKATFESLADAPNFFYMSGLDPAGIAFLTGTTKCSQFLRQQKNSLKLR